LIKDIKRGLEASIGKFTVPRLSMETAVARIEANVNNRPLTDIPVSSLDDTPITPYLLISGYPNYPILDESGTGTLAEVTNTIKLKPALRVNAVVQAFRKRFVQEYAPVISQRTKGQVNKGKLLKMDDTVIYCDPM
jgi:hypothetical protein